MRQKLKDNQKPIMKMTLIFLLYYTLPLYLILINILLNNAIAKVFNMSNAGFQFLFNIIFSSILFFLYKKELKAEYQDFKKNNEQYIKKTIKYWFIGLLVMVIANGLINSINPNELPANEQAIREMLNDNALLMVLATVILAPFIEEIMFRKTLSHIFQKPFILIIANTILFGGAHVFNSYQTPIDLLYIIPYGALGGAFAYINYKSKNIFSSMTIHAIHNGLLIILYLFVALLGAQ